MPRHLSESVSLHHLRTFMQDSTERCMKSPCFDRMDTPWPVVKPNNMSDHCMPGVQTQLTQETYVTAGFDSDDASLFDDTASTSSRIYAASTEDEMGEIYTNPSSDQLKHRRG